MTNCNPTDLIIIRSTEDNIAIISKAIADKKSKDEKITARQEKENTFLIYIEPNNPDEWLEYLENKDIEFKSFLAKDYQLTDLEIPTAFLNYFTNILPLNKISLLASEKTENRLTRKPDTKKTIKKSDCKSTDLIKSGQAQGEATESTFFSTVSPETISAARSRAIGAAAKEAAAEMAKAMADGCTCVEPCICRYMITYGTPTDAGSTDNASLSVSGDLKGVTGTINAGKVTTVSAHVDWSLWKTCVKKGSSGFDNTAPVEKEKKVIIAGDEHLIKCKIFFEHQNVRLIKEYTDEISWTSREDYAIRAAEIRKLRRDVVPAVLEKASMEAGEALLAMDPCPTTCPKASVTMFISPATVRVNNTFLRPYAMGYDEVTQVIGECSYWIYKNCE